jgi:hypothetical protein
MEPALEGRSTVSRSARALQTRRVPARSFGKAPPSTLNDDAFLGKASQVRQLSHAFLGRAVRCKYVSHGFQGKAVQVRLYRRAFLGKPVQVRLYGNAFLGTAVLLRQDCNAFLGKAVPFKRVCHAFLGKPVRSKLYWTAFPRDLAGLRASISHCRAILRGRYYVRNVAAGIPWRGIAESFLRAATAAPFNSPQVENVPHLRAGGPDANQPRETDSERHCPKEGQSPGCPTARPAQII